MDKIEKIKICANMFPEPACQVIQELCDEMLHYRKELERITKLSSSMIAQFMYAQSIAKKAL